jgi:hypothetical protein
MDALVIRRTPGHTGARNIGRSKSPSPRCPLVGLTVPIAVPGSAKQQREGLRRAVRPQLARLLKSLDADDLVIVTRLDRLARSTRDLLNTLDLIAKLPVLGPHCDKERKAGERDAVAF